MYDSTQIQQALITTCPFLANTPQWTDPVRKYVYFKILEHDFHRPYFLSEAVAESVFDRNIAFVYDRPTGLVFTGGFGIHSSIAARLWFLRNELDKFNVQDWDYVYLDHIHEYADSFINTQMGFVCSGVSAAMGRKTLLMAEGADLTEDEQIAFKSFALEQV